MSSPYYTFTATNWVASYSWGYSSNISYISSSGANLIVHGTSNDAAYGLGLVNIKDGNEKELVKYTVWVGTPVSSYINGPTYVPDNYSIGYQAVYNSLSAPSNFYWYTSPYTYVSSYGDLAYIVYYEGDYQLVCGLTNACGYRDVGLRIYVYHQRTSYIFPAYPNPASDMLYIEFDENAKTQGEKHIFDVRLYDGQGNLLRQSSTKGGTTQFNVSNLPDGLYYLHIYDGVNSTPEIQQIMVEH